MLRENLLSLIEKMDIIKNRTAIEAFDYILFQGALAVAFNGTVGIFVPFEVDEPFSVPMLQFSKVVKSCTAEEIDITVAESEVHITSGRLRASIFSAVTPDNEFSGLLGVKALKHKKLPADFINALEMCARTSSNSVTMDVLNSVFVNGAEVVGSDDARVTVVTLQKKIGKFILPYNAIRDIVKFNPVSIGLKASEGWVVFNDAEGNQMAVRTVNDEYPEYKKLFDVEASEVKLPAEVTELIQSAIVFSESATGSEEEYSEAVMIRMKPKGVQVRSENHMGNIVNSAKCKTGLTGTIEIMAHPKMFVEAVALSEGIIKVSADRVIIESEKVRHVAGLQDIE